MSILSTLTSDQSVADEKDVLGGGYAPLESDIYNSEITMAYLMKSGGGAIGVVLHLATEGGREIRQTIYMTSGSQKGCKNTYVDKQGQTQYLPGFSLINGLALLTVGKEISELQTEEKVVNVYNYDAKAEIPTKVEMLMPLLGQKIFAAVQKQVVDKNVKTDDGSYKPTGETREQNEIVKFFRERDKLTTAEIRAGSTEPGFFETWRTKWKGETVMKAKGAAGNAGAPMTGGGAAPSAPAAAGARPSLFG